MNETIGTQRMPSYGDYRKYFLKLLRPGLLLYELVSWHVLLAVQDGEGTGPPMTKQVMHIRAEIDEYRSKGAVGEMPPPMEISEEAVAQAPEVIRLTNRKGQCKEQSKHRSTIANPTTLLPDSICRMMALGSVWIPGH
eukprot:6471420-Amphidinium_carterae.1